MLIRIQTVFLSLAVILTGLFIKLPYSGFGGVKQVTKTETVALPSTMDEAPEGEVRISSEDIPADQSDPAETEPADASPTQAENDIYVQTTDTIDLMLNFQGLTNARAKNEVYNKTFALTALVIITGLLSLITIFLFNKRTLQLRLCVLNILLTLGILVVIVAYYFLFKAGIGLADDIQVIAPKIKWALIIPIANVVLIFQAFRYIRRDELLIRSMDRLR